MSEAEPKMGRPSKFKPEYVDQGRKLAALGATDREIAEFFEVDEATLYRWKQHREDFCEALKVGKDAADDRVEQSLYRRALGYTHDDVHFSAYEGKVTETAYVKHYPPDTTAAIFWLKNRRRLDWRERQEISGPAGGPIEIEERRVLDPRLLDDETRAALRQAIVTAFQQISAPAADVIEGECEEVPS
jgi:hypothetical protein